MANTTFRYTMDRLDHSISKHRSRPNLRSLEKTSVDDQVCWNTNHRFDVFSDQEARFWRGQATNDWQFCMTKGVRTSFSGPLNLNQQQTSSSASQTSLWIFIGRLVPGSDGEALPTLSDVDFAGSLDGSSTEKWPRVVRRREN